MIRVVKDGSMPSQLARREEQNQIYKRTLMRQLNSLKKDKINMLRTYRMGDIPDIQIDFKDIILPLMVLVQKDSTIATEVLVELFTEIYKQIKVAE
jgi:DNA-dependent protein kinase catalytic subunit